MGAGTLTLTGDTTILGTVHIQKDGDVVIGHGLGTAGPVYRARGSRGTLAAPANSIASDVVRYDISEARANDVWQNVSIMGVQIQAASGGKARGDWWLDLADATGTMANRMQILGTGLTTLYGPLTVNGALAVATTLTVNSRPVAMAGCRVYNSAAISVGTATNVALTFDSERYDTDGFHSTSTNTGRLTVPAGLAGKYEIFMTVAWQANADSNMRALQVRLNGATYIAIDNGPALNSGAQPTRQVISTTYDLAVGEYVEIVAHQISGVTLNVLAAGNYTPEFGMQRIG
jgi:hypothetical protein